ncbi:MAG TPA: hypothetical protein DHV59_15660 [Oxalobacteraceae bacterium]|nr:hypothetical protein [Oxalobacteraceae bacterium]
MRQLLAAALLASALPLTAAACGVCIEDKVAATYDFQVVSHATRNGHTVLFYELVGPVAPDPKTAALIAAASAKAAGVEHDSVRVSLQQAALSVVVDAKRASPTEMKNRIEQKLLPWRLGLKLLRTIENGKLSAPA